MKRTYETIVLGCGWIGAAALYWLARRAGSEVLGIEQFALFHHNGGSQDQSRIPQFTPQGKAMCFIKPRMAMARPCWNIAQPPRSSPLLMR